MLWDSWEAVQASEQKLAEFRVQTVGALGMTLESVDLYEAMVVELE